MSGRIVYNPKERDIFIRELKLFLPEDPIFVCIGTMKAGFDSFGPIMGTKLSMFQYNVYGRIGDQVDGKNLYDRIYEITKKEDVSIGDKRIVAIDASSGPSDLYRPIIRPNCGVRPGSGMDKNFPTIGTKSIIMNTITDKQQALKRIGDANHNLFDIEKANSVARNLANMIRRSLEERELEIMKYHIESSRS